MTIAKQPAICVERLGKEYLIGAQQKADYRTLRESLAGATGRAWRRVRRRSGGPPDGADIATNSFWALDDVSFEVQPGEVVGVIGRNGAGKSTLLKILSRITEPTEGRATIRGRVGSLLEVGTGFHPELTGRENVYMNGSILGMSRREIARKFDEIVAFSEVERFLDTPVKRYSSGMQVRLAFAVAAFLEPEILIIDEVLAVGDAQFQRKCLGRMEQVGSEGRTVLFVSHNMAAVQSLCSRVLWLTSGRLCGDGPPPDIAQQYLMAGVEREAELVWDDLSAAPGGDKVRIRRVCVRPERGFPGDPISVSTRFVMEFDYWNLAPGTCLNLSVHVKNSAGITVFNSFPVHEPEWHRKAFPAGLFRSVCHVPGDLLNDGMHQIQLMVVEDEGVVLDNHDAILSFDVLDSPERRGNWHGSWAGAVRPSLHWTTTLLSDEAVVESTS